MRVRLVPSSPPGTWVVAEAAAAFGGVAAKAIMAKELAAALQVRGGGMAAYLIVGGEG